LFSIHSNVQKHTCGVRGTQPLRWLYGGAEHTVATTCNNRYAHPLLVTKKHTY